MGASWQAFYAHLCAASIIRAMPETEIPPAMRGGGIFIIFAQLRPYNIGKINIRIYQNGGNIIKIGIANNK